MKKIKIKFIGFWLGFQENNNIIYNTLSKYYDVELSDQPDYLFYSTFCHNNFDYLNYDCVRIFWSGENASPDFNYCDYSIGFDNISYNDRHLCFPLFLAYGQLNDAANKHEEVNENTFEQKPEFCNFIVGNTEGMQARTDIFHLLNSYKPVASCGTYLTNTWPVVTNEQEKLAFQNRCRFSITFESVAQPGFITEKILHAFAAKTVPIYLGDEDITDVFNPASFVNCRDYDSLEAVVDRVKEIEEDPQLWQKMVSTPCFKDAAYPQKKWAEFDAFLRNIMDQDLEHAYRRPRKFHAVRYSEDIKQYMVLKNNVRFQRFLRCQDNFFVRLALKLAGSR